MDALELRIPPPAVALLVAIAMWAISSVAPQFEIAAAVRLFGAAAIALFGGGIALAGAIAFRRAKTTVNPLKPETTSALVTAGIYTFTRNPMYVGVFLVLVAWAVFLCTVWAFAGPLAFVLYMNRFQISPEERVLSTMFGPAYSAYAARVRRWL